MTHASPLDAFLPRPRHSEIDHVDVAAPPARAWELLRHFDNARSPIARLLFGLRTIPDRLAGRSTEQPDLSIDGIGTHGPGFRFLADDPPRAFVVGAIGRFWHANMEWADVPPERFASFAEPGWGVIAWAIRLEPRGGDGTRVTFELRIGATDDEAWRSFHRYYALIGPFSRFMRRHLLAAAARELGSLESVVNERPLAGDAWIPEPKAQMTHAIDIDAPPSAIWPWLLQMGCDRGGWYSYDALDNAGVPSARSIRPELQRVDVGDVLPWRRDSPVGFHVTELRAERLLVLGSTLDVDARTSLPLDGPRPSRFFRVAWSFVLEPLGERTTRLSVRVRLDYAPESMGWRALIEAPIHHFMESAQARNLKERAEGTARSAEAGPA
jgi:hypothetical protein